MRYEDIKRHLQPFSIYRRRKTTINHAFASAIAPCDAYEAERVKTAIRLLGQDPDEDLKCVYCDKPSETWDHVFATVKDSVFSGAGHRLGNLVPCCKQCNSSKGNKRWDVFLRTLHSDPATLSAKAQTIQVYIDRLFVSDALPTDSPEYRELLEVRQEILNLMNRADTLAQTIRTKASAA